MSPLNNTMKGDSSLLSMEYSRNVWTNLHYKRRSLSRLRALPKKDIMRHFKV
jgi:hypothetical protein